MDDALCGANTIEDALRLEQEIIALLGRGEFHLRKFCASHPSILEAKTNINHQDQETRLLNKPISPRRFKEGGAAILQALNKNHHTAILGIRLIKPLLTRRLRLPNRS